MSQGSLAQGTGQPLSEVVRSPSGGCWVHGAHRTLEPDLLEPVSSCIISFLGRKANRLGLQGHKAQMPATAAGGEPRAKSRQGSLRGHGEAGKGQNLRSPLESLRVTAPP